MTVELGNETSMNPLVLLGIPKMWEQGFLGKDITIAVLDTGIDLDHPEFKGRIKTVRDFTEPNGNGNDTVGHGTHVAGIIASATDSTGTMGVAPRSNLLIGKVIGEHSGAIDSIIRGINWCIQNKVDVINMSLGAPVERDSAKLRDAVMRAYDSGIIVVAAAGNTGLDNGGQTNTVCVPAAYPESWAVGATNNMEHADFSSEGYQLDVVLPGVDILSTVPDGYAKLSGTSMAAPFFSGCVALLIEKFKAENGRKPTQGEMRQLVVEHCKDLGEIGLDASYGYGLFSFDHNNNGTVTFLEDNLRQNK